MRVLFGCLALLLGLVSISLAGRYGFKGADTLIDGVISGVVFGLIALCAFLFDSAAVRLWFMNHRIGAGIVGLIAAAALIVTFTNSLGAIAGRADVTQAERNTAKADQADDRAELRRIMRERAALNFMPATDEAVKVARDAVATAERTRLAECGNGDPKQRGPKCRERETEEQAKRDALATVIANKALTEKAAKLDGDAVGVRTRLAKVAPVQNANPLGAALEQMIGATAAALTAWQQAIVAGVFELCLVGVMVIYELPGQPKPPMQRKDRVDGLDPTTEPKRQDDKPSEPPARQRISASRSKPSGSVKSFARDHLFPAEGELVEIKALMRDYRAWCDREKLTPLGVDAFLDEFAKLCRKIGIETEVGDDQRVYCLDVKLAANGIEATTAPH